MKPRAEQQDDGNARGRRSSEPVRTPVPWLAALLAAGLWLALAPAATAQEGGGTAAATEAAAAAAELEAELARVEALGAEWQQRSDRFTQDREAAPELLAGIESEIAKLEARDAPVVEDGLEIAEVATALLGAEQDLALARREAASLETESATRTERRRELPELLAGARERLQALENEPPPATATPELVAVRQRLAEARRRSVEREIDAYEQELTSYEARGQLLARRRQRAALRISALGERVSVLQDALAARSRDEAESASLRAQKVLESAEDLPPGLVDLVQKLAAENQALVERRTGEDGLLERIDDTRRKLGRADEQVAGVEADLQLLRRKVDAAGLTGSVGLLLRRTRATAPDVGKYRRFIRMRRDSVGEAQLEQIQLVERRQALALEEQRIQEQLSALEGELTPEERKAADGLLRELLGDQRTLLDTLVDDTELYFQKLVDFDARQQELVTRTETLLRFIDERVLWIPSGEPLPPTLLSDARDALGWFLAPRFWGQVARAGRAWIAREPVSFAVLLLLVASTPFVWRRARVHLSSLASDAGRPDCTSIRPTAEALALSLLLALWGPALVGFVGWRVSSTPSATQFVRCVAYGLQVAAFFWLTVRTPRLLLRRNGLAEAHLHWPEDASRTFRRHLAWLAAVLLPATFVIAAFELRGEAAWKESIGRLAYLVSMIAVLAFNHAILREGGPLRRVIRARFGLTAPDWAGRAAHLLALVTAFLLVLAALRGYFWTALQLTASLHVTLFFLLLLLFAFQLGSRWALVASRRLAFERWREAQEAHERQGGASPDAPDLSEPELDLATVDEQTGRLLRNGLIFAGVIGVWIIWGDLVPAGGALRGVELWSTTSTATVEATNAAGEKIVSGEQRLVPVTLADLLLAVVLAGMTIALVRSLPGLLELSLFRRLGTSAGERYAYATIAKYGVTLAGGLLVLNAVGIGWGNVQWLVAAMGLGLGFGLQEIFANFISGLIILFERPIRVGDTVTVGTVSGTVTKIRIRATWITGFDRKELVVPNKEFVTTRLVNWSLSDAVLRIEIPVGIAYGSDTEQANRVLEEVARANANVLADPPPYAIFRGFGDSSLNFELRVFAPDISKYIPITHALHMEIDRAFRKAGIEIAFPQRDLHVRSVPVSRGEASESDD